MQPDPAATRAQPILLSPPDVGDDERTALLRAFDGGWIAPLGPEVDQFEAELAAYVDAPACVALSSGTAALQLALLCAGVTADSEVVVPTFTFAATAFAVAHLGATPVFCDVERSTWGLDPDLLDSFLAARAAADRLPAAVMTVDIYGLVPQYDRIKEICGRYEIPIVEDAAESLGSILDGTMAGMLGDIGAFSFNGNKIITTSGGGALVGERETVDRARHLACQAREPVAHFEHGEVGYNYRLSNLLAAVGRAQLGRLDDGIKRRTTIFENYRSSLPAIEWFPIQSTTRPNHWLSVGLLPAGIEPEQFCTQLGGQQIEARRVFKPMHAQPVFADHEVVGGDVADSLFATGVCLPSGSSLSDDDQHRVIAAITDVLGRHDAPAAR